MVLWEITLATAYFLGIKRTHKLALKIQRKLIPAKYPRIRQFAHRQTRAALDVAVRVHRKVQDMDIEVGRTLGNWIPRWLKAEILGNPSSDGRTNTSTMKQFFTSSQLKSRRALNRFGSRSKRLKSPRALNRFGSRSKNQESERQLFTSTRNMWPRSISTVSMVMMPTKPAGTNFQYRHFSIDYLQSLKANNGSFGSNLVIRPDIMQWMLQN